MLDVGSPYTGSELANAMLALEEAGSTFCRTCEPAEFFAPQGTAWSPALHLRHLRLTTVPVSLALYIPHWILTAAFGASLIPSRPYPQIRDSYRASLTRSTSAGIFAPRPESPPPDPTARREAVLRAWRQATVQFAGAVRRWPETQLDRCRLPHPRLGRLTVRETALFTIYHTAHHLGRIVERAARPALGDS
jgi:DinB family protein